MKSKFCIYSVFFFSFLTASSDAVSLSESRIIYSESQKSRTINVLNSKGGPFIVQASVAQWDTNAPAGAFVVTPPVFRMEADSPGMFRIIYNGEKLSADRETLFRLIVKVVPGGKKPERDTSYVSYSVSLEHKLFFRPRGLRMNVNDAYEKLAFRRDGKRVFINNPTPYYITFSHLSLGEENVDLREQSTMIPPFSERSYLSVSRGKTASWKLINDYGVETKVYRTVFN
ncbi:molecular chaperone [Enterobacter asburiae]|nr:molecular chaperone [Enterobacter asburiae]